MSTLLLWLCFGADVRDLAHDDWARREAAEARLTRNSYLTWRLCDRPFRDPERRARARRVAEGYLHMGGLPPLPALLGPPWYMALWYDEGGTWFADYGGLALSAHAQGRELFCWSGPSEGALAPLVRLYLRRAGAEQLDSPAHVSGYYRASACRDATALLARDLLRLGLPRPLVRWALGGAAPARPGYDSLEQGGF